MTRLELIKALKEKGIDSVYGRSLGSALKRELEDYAQNSGRFGPTRYFSASQVDTYDACPLRYFWRYRMGMKIPPGAFQALGGSYHKAVEHNNREKLQTGTDEPVSILEDVFVEDLRAREQETLWEEAGIAECETLGRGLVRVYSKELAPPVYPKKVEHEFKIEFEDRDWVFGGYIDCVADLDGTYLDEDGPKPAVKNLVLDYKTAGKRSNQDDADADQQLTAYSLAHSIETGEREGGVALAVAVKTKVPKAQILISSRTPDQHWRYLRKVEELTKAIRAGVFVPTNPRNWQCSRRWCGYFDHCMKSW